jgi:hypothetical protein
MRPLLQQLLALLGLFMLLLQLALGAILLV